ncbi:MAG TPA: 3-phosphoshikimate 1-carboxyvinyltransferase, partial [Saprospiraceae bacterium]|nr:3-phosphoshikimate 1-carboxyvinyltransferase [Saprospiraceae bacterium]
MSDQSLRLSFPSNRPVINADVALPGSKSISNRALLILRLAGVSPRNWLSNLSSARDTVTLLELLEHEGDIYNAGDAGTTFRFLTAYLALGDQQTILTGSARMRERPVGALVGALQALGADIEYLEKEGYPPLGIHPSPD